MPTITVIGGVRIVIYPDDHQPPHFHALQGGRDAMFDIETGRGLAGSLDRRATRKVQEWTELNRELLKDAWLQATSG